MLKYLAGAAAMALVLAAGSHPGVAASKKYVFALVPKNTNNPFFDQARDGCKKAEKELKGAIECLYIGPGEHGGGEEQVQIVDDLVAKHVDGIAVSPANAAAMASALEEAKKAGIPVLTWDSDLLPKDKGLRIAYIGTHNYDIGVNLGKLVHVDQAEGRHDLHPVRRRRGGQPQRTHAGHPRHAERQGEHGIARRAADRPERLEGSRRLPALYQRRLHRRGAADGRHPGQVPEPGRLRADRRIPGVRRAGLQARRQQLQVQDRRRRDRNRGRRYAADAD